MRRRLLAVCRGHAATAGLFRRKANPPSSTTSSRTAYRSRRRFLFQSKRHLSLIPSLLLIQTEPAARGFGLGACDEFFLKLVVRSFCCSSLSPRKRFAGLHGDGCGVAVFLIGVPAKARRSGLCGERTSSKVSESRRIRRDEGYEACEDERRRLLAVCRGHAATAGLFRRKANPPSSTSSSQASYRLRRVFLKLVVRSFCCSSLSPHKRFAGLRGDGCGVAVFYKNVIRPLPCSSLSKPNLLRWASVWGLATSFFIKLVVRSFCCSSLSPCKRFAGLHGDGCGVAVFL